MSLSKSLDCLDEFLPNIKPQRGDTQGICYACVDVRLVDGFGGFALRFGRHPAAFVIQAQKARLGAMRRRFPWRVSCTLGREAFGDCRHYSLGQCDSHKGASLAP